LRSARLFFILAIAIVVAVLQGGPGREIANAAFPGGNGRLLVFNWPF
jgi:hypothetical protein